MQQIIIGNSDYNRKELEDNKCGWGNTALEFIKTINYYEDNGYEVRFETNIFRILFGKTKYKIVGYRKLIPIKIKKY